MQFNSIYKPQGGKLIRLNVDLHKDIISDIKICGDFFIHPEESLELIEAQIKGMPLIEDLLKQKLSKFIKQNNIQLIGLSPEDIVEAIILAKENGNL